VKLLVLIALFCLLSARPLFAQDPVVAAQSVDLGSGTDSMLDPLPAVGSMETTPPTTPAQANALDQSLYGDDQALDDAPAEPATQSRPWNVNFHASAGLRHDDNVFISSIGKRSDIVTTVKAGGGVTLGDYIARENNYLIVDYTGIGEIFGRYTGEDAFEQLASFETQILLAHLTLHGAFRFQDLADEDIDTNSRARRQIYSLNGSARYDISDKTCLEATAQVTIAHYDLYLGSNDERGGISFNYFPDPNITTGIGVTAGVLNVQNSASQTYEQLLASLQFDAASKITLNASAGIEDRQASGDNGLITPVFDISADYKPTQSLDVSLAAYRQVENSASYASSDYVSTGVNGAVQFELSSRFTLLLDAGYANTGYRGVSRTDDYFSIRPALRYTASQFCNIEIYYSFHNNHSTLATSSFDDTQIGITANLTY
jgi:hypothetical protein